MQLIRWLALLMVLHAALVLPVVLQGKGGTSEASDQDKWHLPIIERFAAEWPAPDLVNYDSGTTPGYHLLLAGVWSLTGGSMMAMQLASWLLGLAMLAAFMIFASRFCGPRTGLLLTLPLMLSPYTLGPSIWLTTDNAALLFVVLVLGGACFLPYRPSRTFGLGLLSGAAVMVRQIHLWTAAPIGFIGLLASPIGGLVPGKLDARSVTSPERRWSNLAVAIVAGAIPFVIVMGFFIAWKGMMPVSEAVRVKHAKGFNSATPAFILAYAGLVSIFLGPLWWSQVRGRIWRDMGIIRAGAVALLVTLIVPTAYYGIPGDPPFKPRANGWLWEVIRLGGDVRDRSFVVTVLAMIGGAGILCLSRAATQSGHKRAVVTLLLSLLGWTLAQSANTMAWQRYIEPLTLIGMGWLAAMAWASVRNEPRARMLTCLGLGALALLQAGLSALTLYRDALSGG